MMRNLPLIVVAGCAGALVSMTAGYAMGGYATTGIDPAFGSRYRTVAAPTLPTPPDLLLQSTAGTSSTAPERGFDDSMLASRY